MKTLNIKTIVTCVILSGALVSCSHFDELNTNPDGSTIATSQMLATKLILNITRDDISSEKGFMGHFMRDKYILWSEFAQGEQYNRIDRAGFGKLTRLIDAEKMVEFTEELDGAAANSYKGLSHFMRAYTFFNATMEVGDIPYSDALKGESEDNIKPMYDTQKQVFVGILDELDEANNFFALGGSFEGDVIYGGDPVKWQKMVNSFALKVLINLYRKTGDAELRVAERFNDIVNNRPIFESNADNFQLVYSDQEHQRYPFHKLGNQFVIYPMVSDVLIDRLKALNDYRVFYFASPSEAQIENGASASDFAAYKGIDPAIVYASIGDILNSKDYSGVNARYTEIAEGEPVCLLNHAQIQLTIAEAVVRGWVSGDAQAYYADGIRASMHFVADNTPDEAAFHHNRQMDDAYIQAYPATDAVKLTGSAENQINQIVTQKYLGTFLQSPLSAFFENRRTGYPEFPINPASNENVPADRLPVRWMYPSDEINYNTENVREAIDRQFNGNDNVNELMWLLKD
ncbi:SusD/RagB family nutrient-binding outer membrane lipoprotein [Parapedobacter tibetensis]|uniref:SusD/RagB family nutrient-binding outer membrane lipoprotein n=1 Tax=Parapedobacter tibetensis TaxID=2972951 RepID=UPI00214D14CF|nr:SusD/RagB family nutrient-binding outer membrane lipoprotein [Parapedobacter tibetensis]